MLGSRTSRSRAAIAVSALLALGLLAAACGNDDNGDDEAEQNDQAAEQIDASTAAFCDASLGIENTFVSGPDVDFESASEEEVQAALEKFSAALEPLLQDAEENAPEEIAGSVDVGVAAVRTALETGDESATESDEFRQAEGEIDAWTFDNCEVERVDVAAVDYAFEGAPATIPAGTTIGFNFSNEGSELHEMVLLRKNEGTTESAEELLDLPERKAMKKVTFAGASFGPPGESDASFLELEAGDYMMVCFIPVGTTGENKEGDGPPHFTEGMFAEFKVE
jgi:plastocyanin